MANEPTPTHAALEQLLIQLREKEYDIYVRHYNETQRKWQNARLDHLNSATRAIHEARWIVDLFKREGWTEPE